MNNKHLVMLSVTHNAVALQAETKSHNPITPPLVFLSRMYCFQTLYVYKE